MDVINVWTGQSGVTGLRQIAHMAHAHGLPVTMMNAQANYMAQIAAALPNHYMMEVVDPGTRALPQVARPDRGRLHRAGRCAGFGIAVDEAKLRELQANPPAGRGKFPFPRREGAGRYIVPPAPGEVPWR